MADPFNYQLTYPMFGRPDLRVDGRLTLMCLRVYTLILVITFTGVGITVGDIDQDGRKSSLTKNRTSEAANSSLSRYRVNTLYATYEQDCPDYKSKWLQQKQVPWGFPERAYLTLPDGLRIAPSLFPDAGLGVISDIFIPQNTWLGEYEGEIVTPEYSDNISWYTWTSYRDEKADYYIDGSNIPTSSWARFVNCPNKGSQENVVVLECFGKIFYMSSKNIIPGQELLVYYGSTYAKELGLNISDFPYEEMDDE